MESKALLDTDKEFIKAVLTGSYDQGIALCLRRAFQFLSDVCGKKVIFLLDEYDVPLDKACQKGFYEQMLGVIRNLLSTVLKSNDYLQFAVLTGCLRIARENISALQRLRYHRC